MSEFAERFVVLRDSLRGVARAWLTAPLPEYGPHEVGADCLRCSWVCQYVGRELASLGFVATEVAKHVAEAHP